MDSCDTKITFSICKSIVDKKGGSKVVPLSALFNIAEESEREKLLDDAQKVYKRFVGFVPADFKIETEYMLDCLKQR